MVQHNFSIVKQVLEEKEGQENPLLVALDLRSCDRSFSKMKCCAGLKPMIKQTTQQFFIPFFF